MTVKDFLKRVDVENSETQHKIMIYEDENGGWSNIKVEEREDGIIISLDTNLPFSYEY
jgi:hypothetical protein